MTRHMRASPSVAAPLVSSWPGLSKALGHSSISITVDTYSHVMPSMSQVAADAIDAVLGE
jgi:integrase